MESATLHVLQRVQWDFFSGLSFRSERVPERVRLQMFFTFVREVARWQRLPVLWSREKRQNHPAFASQMVWVLRIEAGEKTGRLHFHALLGNCRPSFKREATCFAMMALWERLGGGMARWRLFEPTGDAVEYLCKCLGQGSGGNLYEQSKFSATGEAMMVADAVWSGVFFKRNPGSTVQTDTTASGYPVGLCSAASA